MDELKNDTHKVHTENSDTSTAHNTSAQNSGSTKSDGSSKGLAIGIFAALLVLAGGYYFMQQSDESTDQEEVADPSAFEADQVVARVNGVDLYGDSLTLQLSQSVLASGFESFEAADPQMQQLMQTQAFDAIVNTELLAQAAVAAGFVVTDTEIAAEFDVLVANIGGMEVAEPRLAELGLSIDDFKENLSNDIIISRFVESKNDPLALVVTEEEVQTFYDEAVNSGGAGTVPPLEEVRSQVEQQLALIKQQEVLLILIEELKTEASIESLI
jgi:hypothetical protein